MNERNRDLIEALEFGAAIVNLGGKVFEDGKLTISDIVSNFGDIIALPRLATTAWQGHENIRIADLATAEDRQQVLAAFREALELPPSAALTEEAIEEAANAILALIAFGHKVAAIRQQQ